MKLQNAVWKKLLKASLAAAFTVTPLIAGVSVVQAAPSNYAPAKGHWNNDRGNGHDRNNNRGDKNKSDSNSYQTFTGQASNVQGQQFKLRVGSTTYDVYASSRLPNGINQNSLVRVYGQRYGVNDIRNANVSVVSNNGDRWKNNRDRHDNNHGNTYQTFTGTVNNVESNSKFDIRVGNQTYNVYPSGRVPGQISKNDTVRIYGQRYGVNDIRNANVVIVRKSNSDNNNTWGNYQTFTGTVTSVVSNSLFNVRIGNDIYDVYPSSNVARRVDRGNVVRIYGRRYGVNDIRNANVVIVRNR